MDVWLWNVMHHEEQRERLDTHEKNKQLYYSERKQDNKYIQDEVQVRAKRSARDSAALRRYPACEERAATFLAPHPGARLAARAWSIAARRGSPAAASRLPDRAGSGAAPSAFHPAWSAPVLGFRCSRSCHGLGVNASAHSSVE